MVSCHIPTPWRQRTKGGRQVDIRTISIIDKIVVVFAKKKKKGWRSVVSDLIISSCENSGQVHINKSTEHYFNDRIKNAIIQITDV